MTERDVGVVRRTAIALRIAARRRDTRLTFLVGSLGYALLYSYTTDALTYVGRSGFSLVLVEAPLRRMLQSTGYLSFEPVARVQWLGVAYLFSPLDAALATLLAALVGANLAVTVLGLRQPRACGLHSSGGVLAAVPALFSGVACCGPVILVAVGLQATGVLLTAFRLLVPVALVLLVGSLLAVGRRVDPSLL